SLLSGCFLASQQDIGALQGQLKELSATITQMQANQAELASKMDELNQNLSISNENLAQSGGQLSGLSAKLDDINAALQGGRNLVAEGQEEVENSSTPAMLPSDLFAQAKNHLDKGAYESAATGFKLYIATYPQSENTEQAYMYMGDAYIAAGQTKKEPLPMLRCSKNSPIANLPPRRV
ncbi:MAG: hypothetical protein IKW71_02235, partial [Elusimicrobiaceae bacterium]|nr:hypothetical protein [Elusimicrobiaceae bacterium]